MDGGDCDSEVADTTNKCFCCCPDPSPHLLHFVYGASVLVHTVCKSVHVCLCMSLSVCGDKV